MLKFSAPQVRVIVEVPGTGATNWGSGRNTLSAMLMTMTETASVLTSQPWWCDPARKCGATAIRSSNMPKTASRARTAAAARIHGSPKPDIATQDSIAPSMTNSPCARLKTFVGL